MKIPSLVSTRPACFPPAPAPARAPARPRARPRNRDVPFAGGRLVFPDVPRPAFASITSTAPLSTGTVAAFAECDGDHAEDPLVQWRFA